MNKLMTEDSAQHFTYKLSSSYLRQSGVGLHMKRIRITTYDYHLFALKVSNSLTL